MLLDWTPNLVEGAQLLQAAIIAVSAFVGWLIGHFRKPKAGK